MPIFNAPPGWPTPPPGWTPPEGWQPDPSWPPAPAGHVWWVPDPQDVRVPTHAQPALVGAPQPAATTFLPVHAPAPQPAVLHAPQPQPLYAQVPQQHGPHHAPVSAPPSSPAPYVPLAAAPSPSLDLVAHYTEQERRAGRKGVVLGVVLVVVGLVITVGGYLVADVGDTFVVLWGPVVFGIITIIRNAVRISRAEEAALRQVVSPGR